MMTVDDVDLVIQPSAAQVSFVTQPSTAVKRLMLQHFNTCDPLVQMMIPHNSDARQSVGDEWPLPLIFDVSYGCAALKTWGVAAFIVLAQNHTRDMYYGNVGDSDDHGSGGGGSHGQQASHIAHSQSPDFADMIFGLWMHNVRKSQQKAHAIKVERTQENVHTWLESVE